MGDDATVAPRGSALTKAEIRVIKTMRTARSEADAAKKLGVSVWTIHGHLRNARSRLGAKTTRELVAKVPA